MKHSMRRKLAAVAVAVSLFALVTVDAASGAKPGSTLATFNYTGQADIWTVPNGVKKVTFDLFGAEGGDGTGLVLGAGGAGGETAATLVVKPGQTFEIVVGGSGGFNGGGTGGRTIEGDLGGNGGGASDVRAGACAAAKACDFIARILVAGGGGGAGVENDLGYEASFDGGSGGGDVGEAGTNGSEFGFAGNDSGGGGGTQTTGGAAGNDVCSCSLNSAGTFGSGGTGATGEVGREAAGGGGGGWFGGGGGGWYDAGGGGGSGYITPLALSGSFQTGVNVGDGMVVISKA